MFTYKLNGRQFLVIFKVTESVIQNTSSASFEPQLTQALHSGMSPSPYQVILLPNNVSVCYGFHNKFTEEERSFPRNIVVRHKDRRITGRGENGDLLI